MFIALVELVELYNLCNFVPTIQMNGPKEHMGYKLTCLLINDHFQISIRDLVGQEEYQCFSLYNDPKNLKKCMLLFQVVCTHSIELRKKYFSKYIKEKFSYWLKFILLNTRSSNSPPQVVIVFDKWQQKVYK
jgi:hypothetical protein